MITIVPFLVVPIVLKFVRFMNGNDAYVKGYILPR